MTGRRDFSASRRNRPNSSVLVLEVRDDLHPARARVAHAHGRSRSVPPPRARSVGMCSPSSALVVERARGREAERAGLQSPRPASLAPCCGDRRPVGGLAVRAALAHHDRRAAPRAAAARRRRCRSGARPAHRGSRGKLCQFHGRPSCSTTSGMSSTPSISSISMSSLVAGWQGAKPTPQLPITHGGDAVPRRRRRRSSQVACAVVVRVDVDEARRDQLAARVDLLGALAGDFADLHDAVARDARRPPRIRPVPSRRRPCRHGSPGPALPTCPFSPAATKQYR